MSAFKTDSLSALAYSSLWHEANSCCSASRYKKDASPSFVAEL